MSVKQISVFVQNSPGRLGQILNVLAENRIDIRAITVADTIDFGILRLIVDRPELAVAVLGEASITSSITEVLAVAFEDKPGSLSAVVSLLGKEGINIDYIYAFISHATTNACVIMRVGDIEKATEVLSAHNVLLLPEEMVYNY